MMLEVRGLCAFYGENQALHGLDFALAEGSIVTLLGANGAGKTTTLRALCGMVRTSGDARFEGRALVGRSTEDIVRLGIAHVPEGRGTFGRMTVEENLQLGAMTRRGRSAIAQDIDKVYAHFPRLGERRSQPAGTLSGGEQQMLAVGRALMLRPRLMLLDEPSFGASCTSACWSSSRTRRWRSTSPSTPISSRRDTWSWPARPARSPGTKRCAKRIWGIERNEKAQIPAALPQACFETRPSGAPQHEVTSSMALKKKPHPEEAAERLSRRTHRRRSSDR
jgi:ABC-type branched-subunit amino acid transport system ATPase component